MCFNKWKINFLATGETFLSKRKFSQVEESFTTRKFVTIGKNHHNSQNGKNFSKQEKILSLEENTTFKINQLSNFSKMDLAFA